MGKAEQTRQMIIEQAAVLFNEKGIAATSVDDILAVSNTSKGGFYGHFKSKEELSHVCADYLLGALVERRTHALSRQHTATGKIHAFMELNKNPLRTFIDGGCPIINLATESDDNDLVIKKKIKEVITNAIALFTGILRDGIAAGELSATLEAEEYAVKMFMAIEGANGICRAMSSVTPMQKTIQSLKKELAVYQL